MTHSTKRHNIGDLRREYASKSLLESDVALHPMEQFGKWFREVLDSEIDEANAMTLATASATGIPSARIMLLKGFDKDGFVFFTNYQSFKGLQLEENPKAGLLFFWKELERQVRVTGLVKKISAEESDAYFHSRPEGSRIGAWTSPQSQVVESREWLDAQYLKRLDEFKGKAVPRPSHWGGFLVQPIIVEFWQGRPSRLHDRIQYSLQEDQTWKIERLAP
ncbi:pyridoxamine 5'-phosphate oxidase [Paraflavisolibacter sp. H34]|uniref:pyridoxamine 5'-phosphate oxidase n=1 Tax=Huijunlia imazamoxiresistens TaxID=3127457 RepID=UPI00301AF631